MLKSVQLLKRLAGTSRPTDKKNIEPYCGICIVYIQMHIEKKMVISIIITYKHSLKLHIDDYLSHI